MPKYYATSQFRLNVDENGRAGKVIQPGEEVSASKLGLDEDQWNEVVEAGSVSEQPYTPPGESPAGTPVTTDAGAVVGSGGELPTEDADGVPLKRDYAALNKDDLKALADKRGLEGTSLLSKEKLVEALEKNDEAQPADEGTENQS